VQKIRSYRLLDALGVVRVAERVFFLISVFCVKNGYIPSFWKHIYREPARFTSGFGADICVRDKHKAWAIVNRAEHDSQMDMWTRIVRQHCFDF
jgi:hypothetical protein